MKTTVRLTKVVGKIALFLASMALITGISLFVVGGYLTTWPILRLSPSSARTKALTQVAVSLMTLAQTFTKDEDETENADKLYAGTE